MYARGRNWAVLQVSLRCARVCSVDRGMEEVAVIIAKCGISAVGCPRNDAFVLVGTVDGFLYACAIKPGVSRIELEKQEVVCRFALRVTAIRASADIIHASSESGVVKVIGALPQISRRKSPQHLPDDPNTTAVSVASCSIDGMALEDTLSCITETNSEILNDDSEVEYKFKLIREIKHTTPIEDIELSSSLIYILDMRSRVKVLPSKTVYDHVSLIHCNRYFFCSDGSTLFVEVGLTLSSIYFAEERIRGIYTSGKGGWIFLLAGNSLEMLEINGKEARRKYTYPLPRDTRCIIVDSERALLYACTGSDVERLDLEYAWTDKEIKGLEIEERRIERVIRHEKEEQAVYSDVPDVAYLVDLPLPPSAPSDRGRLQFPAPGARSDEDVLDLFEEESEPNQIAVKKPKMENISTASYLNIESAVLDAPQTPGSAACIECLQNGIAGSVFALQKTGSLAFWSAGCKVVLSERLGHTLVEVTVREKEVINSFLKILKRVDLCAASPNMLVLGCGPEVLVYHSETGEFDETKIFLQKTSASESLLRIICGLGFFGVVTGHPDEPSAGMELTVFSSDASVVFHTSCSSLLGIAASGQYFCLVSRALGDRFRVTLYIYRGGKVLQVSSSSLALGGSRIYFCSLTDAGVTVLLGDTPRKYFCVAGNTVIEMSQDVDGVPVGTVPGYIVQMHRDADGGLVVFPELPTYTPMRKKAPFTGASIDIHSVLAAEVLDREAARTRSGKEPGPGKENADSGPSMEEKYRAIVQSLYLRRGSPDVVQAAVANTGVSSGKEKGVSDGSGNGHMQKKEKKQNPFSLNIFARSPGNK